MALDTVAAATTTAATNVAVTVPPPKETIPAPAPVANATPPPVVELTPIAEPAKPVVEVKYELKLPDGALLVPGAVERIVSFAKERGLTPDQAQGVLERENAAVKAYADAQAEMIEVEASRWIEEAKADKEIGGEGFAKNVELAKRAVDRFGSPAFKKILDDTRAGNNVEVIRTFANVAKTMKEDTFVVPGAQPGPKKSLEELFYPSMAKKENA